MTAVKNISDAVRTGRTTAARSAEHVARLLIDSDDKGLNAALDWSPEYLAHEARRIDHHSTKGRLAGVPVAVKDNIATLDLPTTCASRILDGYVSPFEATVVRRLREAGAYVACKANLDEFAMGSSTEWSAFGRVHHPLDHYRIPGGSSGGSAALVAAGVTPVALGSETGGSVRQPASFCGVVGVKPTYGRVSRHGLVAFGSSLDCVSPFGEKVDDAARILAVISGHDPLDATTADRPPLTLDEPRRDLTGLTIGLPREYFRPTSTPASAPRSTRPSPRSGNSAPRCGRCRSRTPGSRCPRITSWRRPRRRPTWPASTACATAPAAAPPTPT